MLADGRIINIPVGRSRDLERPNKSVSYFRASPDGVDLVRPSDGVAEPHFQSGAEGSSVIERRNETTRVPLYDSEKINPI